MKKTILYIVFLCWFVLPLSATQHVPFEMDFSNPVENAKWQFLNSSDTVSTSWIIGQDPDYAYGDNYMMYLSYNGGATRDYYPAISGRYTCMAYYPLDVLPAGDYILDFRYRGIGEGYIYPRISTTPSINQGYSYPYYYSSNSEPGKWWREGTFPFTSDGVTPYYICFYFYNRYTNKPVFPNPGYAIDAIQIYPADQGPSCTQKPLLLQMTRSGNDATISWAGNASEYQMEYFMNDTTANTCYKVDNITTTSYTFHSETMPEGSYTFRVRSICGRDTSGWTAIDYQLVYDVSKHCMDYLNFSDPNVKPQYGSTSYPGSTTGVDDRGFLSEYSRHTIHNYPRDFDARTNYKLRTFPQGQPASIRLGNWRTGSQAEDIIYTMDVTPEMSILQLRYALVMQLPGHSIQQQPRFTLEFLDMNGKLIDSCGYVDFTASADLEGWHTEKAKEGETDVIWKDWSMVGLNMRDYIGQTVQIRITTKDCSEGAHFGYAYFTMGCSSGVIQGAHCGEKPDQFTVDEGFYYKWYKKYDPEKTTLSTERTFHLTDPMDTATYCVDMINMLKPECWFTLEASSLAFAPHANGSVEYVPSGCKNYVQLSDASSKQGVYWKEDGTKMVVQESPNAEEILWDLGQYGTSTDPSPKIALPDAGDTLHITLHAYMENRRCEDSMTFDLVVPAVGVSRTINTHYFCHGGSITYKDKVYTEEVAFSDTLVGSNGCDSISTVALRFFQIDTVSYYDTICTGGSIKWNGQTLTQGGEYFAAIKSIIYECDSVHNVLYLHQQPLLDMAVGYEPQAVCATGGTIAVPFTVAQGDVVAYDLLFSDKMKKYGWSDRILQPVSPAATSISIPVEGALTPGVYDASLVFHNLYCDSLVFPLAFSIYYHPDSLITQRWNDFLSVRKKAYDYYGGFVDYQWYKNDQPLPGQTQSQLYLPEEGLESGSAYAVEVTRLSDGMRTRTCPYFPKVEPNSVTITVTPTVISSQAPAPLRIHSPRPAKAVLYNQDGIVIAEWEFKPGVNTKAMPAESGLYLLRIMTDEGEKTVRKILVL